MASSTQLLKLLMQQLEIEAADSGETQEAGAIGFKGSQPQLVNFQTSAAQGTYFAPNSLLAISSWNTVVGQQLVFQMWYLDPRGTLLQLSPKLLPPLAGLKSDRTRNIYIAQLPKSGGIITSFTARVNQSQTVTFRGQTLVKAEVDNTGSGGNLFSNTSVLVQNYATSTKDVTYPADDSIVDPLSGDGYRYTIPNPNTTGKLGKDLTLFTVPANARWRVHAIEAVFNTVLSNSGRYITFALQDANGNFIFVTGALLANLNGAAYNFGAIKAYPSPVDGSADVFGFARAFWPDEKIPAGYVMLTHTLNEGVLDQWTAPFIDVEEWLEPTA